MRTDFVLLAPQRPDRALAWLPDLMTKLGLTLHPEKTRVLDARREAFAFLGHTHRCAVRPAARRVWLEKLEAGSGEAEDDPQPPETAWRMVI